MNKALKDEILKEIHTQREQITDSMEMRAEEQN